MYNLNVSITGPPMLGVDGGGGGGGGGGGNNNGPNAPSLCGGVTPRTPEILNTVMQMANPYEYSFTAATATSPTTSQPSQSQVSQSDSHSSCSGSPLDSPAGTTATDSQNVKKICSQFIKTSLRVSLQKKRKASTGDSSSAESSKIMKRDIDTSDDDNDTKSNKSGHLTAEDEDRRRRRRERNKIAATKCRLKKRERTNNLISESQILEKQNIDFISQVRNLEMERISLTQMLNSHSQNCVHTERFQAPALNVSIEKYLNDSNQPSSSQCDQLKGKMTTIKISQQKIPSVNTLRFSGRRGHRQQHTNHLDNATITAPVMAPTATTTTQSLNGLMMDVTPVDCKPPISAIDMGFCEGNELVMVNSMISPNGYCKQLPVGECYAISSPDSGFIKSPVDIATYPNLQSTIIKTDYIPNCDTNTDLDLEHHHHQQVAQLGLSMDNGTADEFTLKSELNDGNDSPYTTVQSADRFLFDGDVTFDPDMEQQHSQNDHLHLNHDQQTIQSPYNQHLTQHHSDSIKNLVMLQNNNNNNNNNSLQNNNNNNHHINNNNNNHNHMNNNTNADNSTHPMIEYSSSCQNFIDSSLLKGDYLNQNAEFLTITGDPSDTQFTDLDSGVTSYTNMTNGSGCLA